MRAFWFGMAIHLWQTTLVLAALLVLDRLMRQAPSRLRHLLWSAGLLKLLVPFPLLAYLWPSLSDLGSVFGREPAVGSALVTLGRIASPRLLAEPVVVQSVAPAAGWPLLLTTVLWALGVVLLVGRWLWWTRRSVVAGARPWEIEVAPHDKVERAASAAGIPLARLRITDQPVMPCVRRLAHSVVVIPQVVVERLEADELRAILLHEEAHRTRRDLWWNALRGLAARVFFFYPPVWWLSRRLQHTAEIACDEAVVGAGVDAADYARALATTVRLGMAPAGATSLAASRGSSLTDRLARLNSNERYLPMTRHKMYVGLAFVLALFLSLSPSSGSATAAATWIQEGADLSGLNGIDRQITLRHHDVPLVQVYEELGRQAGIMVECGPSVYALGNISVAVSDATIREVLELLAQDASIEYRVTGSEMLSVRSTAERSVVIRRTPQQEQPVRKVENPDSPDAVGPVRVGGDIEEPEKIRHVSPEYPDEARRARMEGVVIVEAVIDREGNVKDVTVLRPLDMGLTEAAVAAVEQWKYTPTLYNGEPVEVVVTMTVQFQLIR